MNDVMDHVSSIALLTTEDGLFISFHVPPSPVLTLQEAVELAEQFILDLTDGQVIKFDPSTGERVNG